MKQRSDKKLGRLLVLEELFDYSLYQGLYRIEQGELRGLLEALIPIEAKHLRFWEDFFELKIKKLNFWRAVKLQTLLFTRRLFGTSVSHLILEAIEIYGVRKYLRVWDIYKDTPLGNRVREVLEDELRHEDSVISETIKKKIDSGKIRDIFLGLNDGLVETIGAVSGFFAAFSSAATVITAGFTVAVAGAFSMAAGVFVAMGSEREVQEAEKRKNEFLGEKEDGAREVVGSTYRSAFIVGISYFVGAMIPITPVLFGTRTVIASILAGGSLMFIVSFIVAFLSGMDIKKRIGINLIIMALAVTITYGIGFLMRNMWGFAV